MIAIYITQHLPDSTSYFFFFLMIRRPPRSTLFPYTNALPISICRAGAPGRDVPGGKAGVAAGRLAPGDDARSEEHTSELQSRLHLVCRLLLEKKKKTLKRVYSS